MLVEGESNANVAVNAGVNHCSERENLFRRSQVERFALEHCLGEQSFSHFSSVEAGNPFKLLQQHGIMIAHLEESRRQKD